MDSVTTDIEADDTRGLRAPGSAARLSIEWGGFDSRQARQVLLYSVPVQAGSLYGATPCVMWRDQRAVNAWPEGCGGSTPSCSTKLFTTALGRGIGRA